MIFLSQYRGRPGRLPRSALPRYRPPPQPFAAWQVANVPFGDYAERAQVSVGQLAGSRPPIRTAPCCR